MLARERTSKRVKRRRQGAWAVDAARPCERAARHERGRRRSGPWSTLAPTCSASQRPWRTWTSSSRPPCARSRWTRSARRSPGVGHSEPAGRENAGKQPTW